MIAPEPFCSFRHHAIRIGRSGLSPFQAERVIHKLRVMFMIFGAVAKNPLLNGLVPDMDRAVLL